MEKRINHILPVILTCMVITAVTFVIPFSNRVVTGSEVSGGKISLFTSSSNRFTSTSIENPVEMLYQITVNEYTQNVPSDGTVSAFTYGTLLEGRDESELPSLKTSFSDTTSVRGSIILFEKSMRYTSGLPTVF